MREAMDIHVQNETEGSVAAAAVLTDLAMLRRDQGDLANGIHLAETAVGLRLKLLGVQHSDFAAGVYNLRSLYQDAGDTEKADALGELLENYECTESTGGQVA